VAELQKLDELEEPGGDMSDWSVAQEAIKAFFSAGVSAVTLSLGWFVGNRLSARWAVSQKRREEDLSAASELHRLYGESFAVWKLWNRTANSGPRDSKEDARWQLAERAASVDAGFESLLLRLTSERILDRKIRDSLGTLRQGFQHLRQSIFEGHAIEWSDSEHPQYSEFKRLTCATSVLLASERNGHLPTPEEADAALRDITSNRHEAGWAGMVLERPSNVALNATSTRAPAR
jgi:hypothetical protein